MKIEQNAKVMKSLGQFYSGMEMSERISQDIVDQIEKRLVFDDYTGINLSAVDFIREQAGGGAAYTVDQALIGVMVTEVLGALPGMIASTYRLPDEIIDMIIRNSTVYRAGAFESNAYLQNVQFKEQTSGTLRMTKDTIERYELFQSGLPVDKEAGLNIPQVCTFDHPFSYPCIARDNDAIMCVSPMEINETDPCIRKVSGNVLALHCRMGYFAYMASLKDSVTHITIVEHDPELVHLFNEHILPQFAHPEKITIICADEAEYLREVNDGEYSSCFVDQLGMTLDLSSYLEIRTIAGNFKKTKFSYYSEHWLNAMLSQTAAAVLMNQLSKDLPIEEGQEVSEPTEDMKMLAEILDDETIASAKQAENCTDARYIIKKMIRMNK